jgi:cytochrome c
MLVLHQDTPGCPMPSRCAIAMLTLAAVTAAAGVRAGEMLQNGNHERGRRLLAQYQCASCHRIPGVEGPQGHDGPALGGTGRAAYIAGHLPNTPDTLARFVQNPQRLKPGTLMPALGVTAADARDMAAYLQRLR